MNKDALQQHMASTYHNLRWALAIISFTFPLFLYGIGRLWYNIPLQNSISAYYFAGAHGDGPIRSWITHINIFPIKYLLFVLADLDGDAPMRTWFVGALFVLGIFLYLYKGFSTLENNLLNVAGLAAVGVALFPMEWNCTASCSPVAFHDICALVAFLCIALVAVLCSKDTLQDLPPLAERKKKFYQTGYHVTAIGMIVFPLIALVITKLTNRQNNYIFAVELLGLWTFAAYWIIKSRELDENRTELHVLEKTSKLASDPPESDSVKPTTPLLKQY